MREPEPEWSEKKRAERRERRGRRQRGDSRDRGELILEEPKALPPPPAPPCSERSRRPQAEAPPPVAPPKSRAGKTIRYKRPPCYPKQQEAIFDCKDKDGNPARYGMIEASTKAGKTRGCIAWLVEQAGHRRARRAQLLVGGAGLCAGRDRLPPHQAGAAQGRASSPAPMTAISSCTLQRRGDVVQVRREAGQPLR
jgi:hypothetical protein